MAKRFIIRKKSAAIVIKKDGATGEWLFSHGADSHGPMSLPELKNAVTAGLLQPDDRFERTADFFAWRRGCAGVHRGCAIPRRKSPPGDRRAGWPKSGAR